MYNVITSFICYLHHDYLNSEKAFLREQTVGFIQSKKTSVLQSESKTLNKTTIVVISHLEKAQSKTEHFVSSVSQNITQILLDFSFIKLSSYSNYSLCTLHQTCSFVLFWISRISLMRWLLLRNHHSTHWVWWRWWVDLTMKPFFVFTNQSINKSPVK